ncbi:hypothetical protein [uncultured Thiodictyon sp.]|uniref:hypothetical protein n=1 Tax=uncultured Thiodictyon sp. TaxID=1846217 RepID=UPI0025DE2546|nr:hypothetical protein [uncultured Thiodictyon sp.]
MRRQTAIDMGDSRSAVVRELRVRDMRRILERAQDLQNLAEVPITELLSTHLPELLGLAADSLTLPPETSIDDLSVSEIVAIKDAWWALHADFFAPVVALVKARLATTLDAPLTAPASPASRPGM